MAAPRSSPAGNRCKRSTSVSAHPLTGIERGETLIEILVTVAILGFAIAGLVGALGDNAIDTAANRAQSQAQSTLVSATEYVKSLSWSGSGCSPSATQTIPANIVPHDSTLTVTYGPAATVDGVACAHLEGVPVTVSGNGYNLSVTVVKRA